jgi:DNA-binding MarR family transcriptional regulator/GNAT superfamily N-acetyltransferase
LRLRLAAGKQAENVVLPSLDDEVSERPIGDLFQHLGGLVEQEGQIGAQVLRRPNPAGVDSKPREYTRMRAGLELTTHGFELAQITAGSKLPGQCPLDRAACSALQTPACEFAALKGCPAHLSDYSQVMDKAMVAQVRRFNRIVTQRVGALDDRFLARDRPLGEARVLWEIGAEGCDVRVLRSRLNLDSGYLSRLLRSLEAAGLIRVEPGKPDRRVRTARLTSAGLAERAVLDERSDALAVSFLEPLNEAQRNQLISAMSDVERLLTAVMVEIRPVDPLHPHARYCLKEYFGELDRRFEGGFDPSVSVSAEADELRPPRGMLLIATLRSDPIGCGALKFHDGQPTEIKRMWVTESARGLGIGRRILADLEAEAYRHGSRRVRLETNRSLTEAIAMYRTAGYLEVDAFNDEPYAHHWFEKHLTGGPG